MSFYHDPLYPFSLAFYLSFFSLSISPFLPVAFLLSECTDGTPNLVLILQCFVSPHAFQDSDSDDGKTPGGGGGGDTPHDGDADLSTFGPLSEEDDFPPRRLLGPASDSTAQPTFAAAAGTIRGGNGEDGRQEGEDWQEVHPVVARRGLDFLWYLCKTSLRVTYDMLTVGPAGEEDDTAGGSGGVIVQGARAGSSSAPSEAKGKGKGKGRRGRPGKGKGKLVEAMDVAGVCVSQSRSVGVSGANAFA